MCFKMRIRQYYLRAWAQDSIRSWSPMCRLRKLGLFSSMGGPPLGGPSPRSEACNHCHLAVLWEADHILKYLMFEEYVWFLKGYCVITLLIWFSLSWGWQNLLSPQFYNAGKLKGALKFQDSVTYHFSRPMETVFMSIFTFLVEITSW